jgi:hypothetical protein
LGGKTATTTQQVQIPPEVLARYQNVNERAQQVSETPFQRYTGEFVAPLSPTQQYGIQQTVASAQLAQPYYQAATQLGVTGAQGIRPGALDPGAYMNPYTQAVVQATLNPLQQQQRQQLSQQQSESIRSGAFGGDRAGLQRAALMGQQSMGTAQAIAPLYQQGYTQALQTAQQQQGLALSAEQANRAARASTAQQLAGFGAGAQQAAQAGAQGIIGAGTLEQQTRQALNAALLQQFQQERGYPFQVAQFLANIAYGAPYPTTTTTTQPVGLLGALSDRRAKKDIKRVGKTDDGMPIYKYKYKGDPSGLTHMGLMAQDVEKTKPEAVGLAGGLKTVDYDRATKFYGGGVGDSMGGAVVEPGEYADGGLADILAIQRAMYGQQGGAPGGLGGGSPYGKGIIDIVPIQRGTTPSPGAIPKLPPSALQELGQTADLGKKLLGKEGLFGEEGVGAKLWDKSKDIYKKFSDRNEARGGLVGYARGGPADDDDDMPYGDTSGGLGIPQQKIQPFRPQAPGQPSDPSAREKQGLSDLKALYGMGEMAATGLESILPFLFLSTGGLVPRAGFADGGEAPSDDELAIRTMLSEAGRGRRGEINPEEALGVGAVIANRARSRGLSPGDVVLQRGQFEPWATPGSPNDPMKWDASSPEYKQMAEYWNRAKSGEDPTGGASHFYAPAAQAALGRAAPDWAKSPGVRHGATSFHRVEGGAGAPSGPAAPLSRGLAPPAASGPENEPESAFTKRAKSILPTKGTPEGGEEINWKQLIIPVLSGLGAAASSRNISPIGTALIGLGAGAESYANLEKQQADVDKRRAEAAREWLGTYKDAIFKGADGNDYIVTTKGGVVLFGTYKMDPDSYGEVITGPAARRAIAAFSSAKPMVPNLFGPYAPAVPGAPGAPAPGAPPASSGPGEPPAPDAPAPAPAAAPGAPAAPAGAPLHISTENPKFVAGAPTPFTMVARNGETQREEDLRKFVVNPASMAAQKTESDKTEAEIQTTAASAKRTASQLNDLSVKLLSLPDLGLSATGPTEPARRLIAAYTQELMKFLNIPSQYWINEKEVGTQYAANKISSALSMAQGSQSVEALKTALAVVPNTAMPREGIIQMLAQTRRTIQRDIDLERYLNEYKKKLPLPFSQNYLAQSARAAFDRDNPFDAGSEETARLEYMMRQTDRRTGKPIWLNYFGANKVPSYFSDRQANRVGFRRYIENN